MKIVLDISIFLFNKTDLWFAKKKLIWKSYITAKALFTIKQIKIINKKNFILIVLNLKNKIFIIYIISVKILVYSSWKTLIADLKIEKVIVSIEYLNFAKLFFSNFVAKLLEQFETNNHFINLENDKQLFYKPIYSLRLIEIEILKIYIKINLASNFIKLLKLSISLPILFVYKKNSSLWLCINYEGLNNLIINNYYLFLLIGKLLNQLS